MTSAAPRDRLAAARALCDAIEGRERDAEPVPVIRLVHERDMRTGRYVVRGELAHPPSDDVIASVGQALHELRTALDDLATGLSGAPARFPIHESLQLFAQRARKSISRMPDQAQAGIEALQPYHAIGGYRNGPLWRLDQLAMQRPVQLAAGYVREGAELGVNTRRKVELTGDAVIAEGAFDAGAVLASQGFRIVGPDPKIDLYFRARFALAFATDGPARGAEVVAALRAMTDHVEQVVLAGLEPLVRVS